MRRIIIIFDKLNGSVPPLQTDSGATFTSQIKTIKWFMEPFSYRTYTPFLQYCVNVVGQNLVRGGSRVAQQKVDSNPDDATATR